MISRRSLLSWLGTSAAGATALSALSTLAHAEQGNSRGIVVLESFGIADRSEVSPLHKYIAEALLPCMKRVTNGRTMALEAIVAPRTPQMLLLAGFSSFDQMLDARSRISSDSSVRRARAHLESAQVLDEVRSHVLLVNQDTLRFPADSAGLRKGILEVRTWHAPAWQEGPPSRLNAALGRAGIHPMVAAGTAAGEHLPRFTYVIPFESLAARQQAWARLEADAAWNEIQRESLATHGSAMKVTAKAIYRPAPYSPTA